LGRRRDALGFRFAAINLCACATSASTIAHGGSVSSLTAIHPRCPTYGGRQMCSGSASISAACAPSGAGSQIETCSPP
jgi:hypothetical protein